jgi:hypothetical protein
MSTTPRINPGASSDTTFGEGQVVCYDTPPKSINENWVVRMRPPKKVLPWHWRAINMLKRLVRISK